MTSVLPILALLGCGWWVARRGVVSATDLGVLGRFVVNISLPALLFSAMGRLNASSGPSVSLDYLWAYGGASVLAFGLVFALAGSGRPRAYAAVASAGPNSAFVTFPILALVLPMQAESVLVMNLIFENVVLLPLFLIALEMSGDQADGLRRGAMRALQRLCQSPLVWAIVLGGAPGAVQSQIGAVAGVDLAWPSVMLQAAQWLGQASVGIALVCIGGNLAQARLGLPELRSVLLPVAGKLLLHPFLVGMAVWVVWPLEPAMATAAVLAAMAPTFSVFPMFALRHGVEVWASQVLLISTLGSLAMMAVALAVFGL